MQEKKDRPKRVQKSGFSLIEVMIVLTMMAVIMIVGIPNYLAYRDTSILENEKHVLLGIRLNIEKFVATYNRVPTASELIAESYSQGFPFGYTYTKIANETALNDVPVPDSHLGLNLASVSPAAALMDVSGDGLEFLLHQLVLITAVDKVTICHIPPGNPEKAHTITIGEPAVAAHLENHGDYLGACRENDHHDSDDNRDSDHDNDSNDGDNRDSEDNGDNGDNGNNGDNGDNGDNGNNGDNGDNGGNSGNPGSLPEPTPTSDPQNVGHYVVEYPVRFLGKCNHNHFGERTFLVMTRETDPVLLNKLPQQDQDYISTLLQYYTQN